jgi:hypothetical protein
MSFEAGCATGAILRPAALSGLSVGFRADQSKVTTKEVGAGVGRRQVRTFVPGSARLVKASIVAFPCSQPRREGPAEFGDRRSHRPARLPRRV